MQLTDTLLWSGSLFGGLLMWGTQVGPKQAVSHTAEWIKALGIKNPPRFLKSEEADRTIRHIGLLSFAVCAELILANYTGVLTMKTFGPTILFSIGVSVTVAASLWSLFAPKVQESASSQQISAPTVLPEDGILLECHIAPRPPASDRIYTLFPFPIPQEQGGAGLAEQFFGDALPSEWSPKLKSGTVPIVHSCKLTNYRADPVFQIQMSIRLRFFESIRDADGKSIRSGKVELDRTWPIEIAKLEPGASNSFEFFVHNINDNWVQTRFPDSVTARTAAGLALKIPLIQQTSAGVTLHLAPYLEGKD